MARENRTVLGTVAPEDLVQPRLLAHQAVQWPSRAARAALEPSPDDSHTNLGWDSRLDALVSQEIPTDGGAVRFGLRSADLTLICAQADGGTEALPLDGATNAAAAIWVASTLTALGLDPSGLDNPLPYELPPHAVSDGGTYEAAAHADGLAELSIWFDLANAVLGGIAGAYSGLEPGPSTVRCWPHHFDLATLIRLDAEGGEAARSVGVGMTPGDGGYAQPYFYVTPWPYPDAAALPPLGEPAFWHTQGWVGAVIEGTAVVETKDARSQEDLVRAALGNAVDICLSVLGG